MSAYKDKGGRWYVSVRYRNWLGKPSRKTKRGFTSKRDALAWEREFLQKYSGSLDMTFNSFYEVYRNDLQNRIRQNTWVTKSSIIEKKDPAIFRRQASTGCEAGGRSPLAKRHHGNNGRKRYAIFAGVP